MAEPSATPRTRYGERTICLYFEQDQYHIEIENEDFHIDLLFYHLKFRCYVVIEIKTATSNRNTQEN